MSRNLDAFRSAYAIRGHARASRRALGVELRGPAVAFELLIVDSISPELSGKYWPARSHVASSYEGVALPAIAS